MQYKLYIAYKELLQMFKRINLLKPAGTRAMKITLLSYHVPWYLQIID